MAIMKHGPDHEFSTMEGRVVNAFDSSFQKGRSETGKYPPENLFHRRVFHLDPAIVNRGIVKIPIVNFLFQFTAGSVTAFRIQRISWPGIVCPTRRAIW
jgi:hypothetical protein